MFADAWLTTRNFSILLALLIVALFPDVILCRRTFFFRDFSIFGYSWASFHRYAFWRAELPLWNPLSNCGIPFLAQWNTLTLYPLSFLYLLFPLSAALGWFCLLHLWLAGLGMYQLALQWTKRRWPAAFAGLAFAFGGLTLNSLTWPNNIAALAWMPWVVRLSDDFRERPAAKGLAAAAAGVVQMLAGAPEITFLTWVLVAGLWVQAWVARRGLRARLLRRFFFLVLVVAGLAAVQLLPFLDLLRHSQRDRSFGGALWPMPLWGVANFFVPLFFTFPWGGHVFFQYDQYWTTSYYVGIATVILGVSALWKARGRAAVLGVVLGLSLVLAMGERAFLYDWARSLLPALGFMRYPIKFVVLAVFILPLLAAFALARFEESRSPRFLLAAGAAGIGAILLILGFARFHPLYGGPYNRWPETLRNGCTRAGCLIAFLAALWGIGKLSSRRARGMAGLAGLLLLWADLATQVPWQNPTIDRSFYESLAGARGWLRPPRWGESRAMVLPLAEAELHQTALPNAEEDFLRKRLGLYCNLNLLEAVPKINGVFSLEPRQEARFQKLLYSTANPSAAWLDFLGVSAATAPGKTIEWRARTGFMPLISAARRVCFAGPEATFRAIKRAEFDPRQTVYLPLAARRSVAVPGAGGVRITRFQAGLSRVSFDTAASGPAVLVVAQSFYHWWRLDVDGRPAPLWRADYAFQAIQVPAGHHHIKLVYQDHAFFWGAALSAGASLLWLARYWRSLSRKCGY